MSGNKIRARLGNTTSHAATGTKNKIIKGSWRPTKYIFNSFFFKITSFKVHLSKQRRIILRQNNPQLRFALMHLYTTTAQRHISTRNSRERRRYDNSLQDATLRNAVLTTTHSQFKHLLHPQHDLTEFIQAFLTMPSFVALI